MQYKNVHVIYFSPSGTTRKYAERLASRFSGEPAAHDLLACRELALELGADDLLLIALPVFAGRIPAPCAKALERLKGNRTPAVALVVYGNRAYEDALLELKDILEGNGFLPIGAGAVLARHSIFPKTAAGRPDEADFEKLDGFRRGCAEKLERLDANRPFPLLAVKGSFPYRKGGAAPLRPDADASCTACGLCARLCPVGAIDPKNPRKTGKRCISCTACVAACPQKARRFRGLAYRLGEEKFLAACSARKEPEFFL